jgi:site-specific recombinase XerD
MDPFAHIHRTPAAWLRRSDFAPVLPAYWQYLSDRRYADETQRVYVCCVAHFARWLSRRGRAAHDLTDDDIRRFLDRHEAGAVPPARCSHGLPAIPVIM